MGYVDLVSSLLEYGARLHGSRNVRAGNSLLHGAAWFCDIRITEQLLRSPDLDINAQKFDRIHTLDRRGRIH